MFGYHQLLLFPVTVTVSFLSGSLYISRSQHSRIYFTGMNNKRFFGIGHYANKLTGSVTSLLSFAKSEGYQAGSFGNNTVLPSAVGYFLHICLGSGSKFFLCFGNGRFWVVPHGTPGPFTASVIISSARLRITMSNASHRRFKGSLAVAFRIKIDIITL